MEFVSLGDALERLGKQFAPPDWYIEHPAPATVPEMHVAWLADSLLRKYRESRAASRLYAAACAEKDPLIVYHHSLDDPVPDRDRKLVDYLGLRAHAIKDNLNRSLVAVRRNEVSGISALPAWWSAFDKGHTTVGFDVNQLNAKFGTVAEREPAQAGAPSVTSSNGVPSSTEAASLPKHADSGRALVHRTNTPNPMRKLVRSIMDDILQHSGIEEHIGPADLADRTWQKVSAILSGPDRPAFLHAETPGNRERKIAARFEYTLRGAHEAYSETAMYEEAKRAVRAWRARQLPP